MSGSATIGSNLVDSLLSVVDDLRSDLHPSFGVRQFNVYTVERTWPTYIGEGSATDTETLIDPQPRVLPYRTEFNLQPCGIDEAGKVQLTEISLTYTEAELTGSYGEDADLGTNVEWLYKLTDAHGQEIETTYWVLASRPFPDRENTIGWIMELTKAGSEAL